MGHPEGLTERLSHMQPVVLRQIHVFIQLTCASDMAHEPFDGLQSVGSRFPTGVIAPAGGEVLFDRRLKTSRPERPEEVTITRITLDRGVARLRRQGTHTDRKC